MNLSGKYGLIFISLLLLAFNANAQVDDICSESGLNPSLDSPFAHVPYVFGHIVLKGYDPAAKLPNVTVIFEDGPQLTTRLSVGKSGNYCFRRKSSSGTLIIEVDGIVVTRRTLTAFGSAQQREDFEIYTTQSPKPPPGVVSAKFVHPTNPKTVELYKKAVEAENKKNIGQAIEQLKEIVSIDPADFIAWAKLGVLYVEKNSFPEAEAAFRKSLELKIEYTPAWVHVGRMRVAQKQFEAAIEIFKHVTTLEPTSARAFQLLGEAYLQARQGTLGAQALNEAIKLDPIGMAECHLLLAHLYQLANAKQLAAREYKIFLTKVPNHPDKKKFEEFIRNNPE
ncbi:MAG: tetratricopeptide repeat protein [Acidobacteriota bacterium]|nr:tetratricopeptide repeat protein [Acidobacteriota bacterium]